MESSEQIYIFFIFQDASRHLMGRNASVQQQQEDPTSKEDLRYLPVGQQETNH